jgi:hypothetical protein
VYVVGTVLGRSRRVLDYQKTIADFERRFVEACKELKIEGGGSVVMPCR